MRRFIDILLSGLGLLVLSLLLLLISLAIVVFDGWPVLYIGKRVGQHGRVFGLYKFRTMVPTPNLLATLPTGSSITIKSDPRVTRIGAVLRRLKLDELPQLLNVLFGQMSLVGPRPEDPEYVAFYSEEQRRLLNYKPGITSLAALEYLDEGELLTGDDWEAIYRTQIMPAKLAIEVEYAERRTIRTDLALLNRTVLTLGRRAIGGRGQG